MPPPVRSIAITDQAVPTDQPAASDHHASPAPVGATEAGRGGKVSRNRARQMRRFADAALHIVSEEGIAELTMSRLADELDTVPSALYRYFPSKAALITAVQCDAIERLNRSYAEIRRHSDVAFARRGLDGEVLCATQLVLFGDWFCATADTHLEELRLLQMIMTDRSRELDVAGGLQVLPVAMVLLSEAAACLDRAAALGIVTPASQLERVIVWAAALGGVLETDRLSMYVPDLLGDGRLARSANLDLLRGWGVPAELLERARVEIGRLAESGPLAPVASVAEGHET